MTNGFCGRTREGRIIIELERTYLAKYLPKDLADCPSKDLLDIYIPASADHPNLRVRKNGQKFEITKKTPVDAGDSSRQMEETIPLTKEEFDELSLIQGKRVHKLRYQYPYRGNQLEIDVFQEGLKGLVLVDAELESQDDMKDFIAPDFCLAEVTQETFIAGGMLCGKSYNEIEPKLKQFGYESL